MVGSQPSDFLVWNMFGYAMEKLGQLMSTFPAALAYVLLETHFIVNTPALGTPTDYHQLVLPNQ